MSKMEKKFIPIMKDIELNLEKVNMNSVNDETSLESKELSEVLLAIQAILDRINTLNEISVYNRMLISNLAFQRLRANGVNINEDHACNEIRTLSIRDDNVSDEIDKNSNKGINEIKLLFERLKYVAQS
jgi:hypothetical protein